MKPSLWVFTEHCPPAEELMLVMLEIWRTWLDLEDWEVSKEPSTYAMFGQVFDRYALESFFKAIAFT